MSRALWWFFPLALLAGCASAPRFHAVCVSAPPATALLAVERKDGSVQRMLLHAEQRAGGQSWAALDTLGTPLFTARQRGDQLTADTHLGYRGVDPLALLWGYQWWLLQRAGEDFGACATATGYRLARAQDALTVIARQPRWRWQGTAPQVFELPGEQVRVSVKVLEQ